MKADDLPFPKMWWFFILQFKPELLLLKVGSNMKFYLGKLASFSEPAGRQLSYGIPGYLLKIFALE